MMRKFSNDLSPPGTRSNYKYTITNTICPKYVRWHCGGSFVFQTVGLVCSPEGFIFLLVFDPSNPETTLITWIIGTLWLLKTAEVPGGHVEDFDVSIPPCTLAENTSSHGAQITSSHGAWITRLGGLYTPSAHPPQTCVKGFYYEQQIKRELKGIHICGCRCHERLKANTGGSTRLIH